jgi:hypothetical protein
VYAYLTSSEAVGLWGERLDTMRTAPENALFPGAMALLFGALAFGLLLAGFARRWHASPARDGRLTPVIALLFVCAVACLITSVWILLTGGRIVVIAGSEVRLRNLARFTIYGSLALGLAAALSGRLRDAFRGPARSLAAGSLAAAFAAFMLSLGPRMEAMNEFIGYGPYALAYNFIPGFDGLRVPSRYAMIVVLWLAVAAAYAGAALSRSRIGAAVIAACALLAIAESHPRRFGLDMPFWEPDHAPLSMTPRLRAAEPLYAALRPLPRGVLLELPWGTTGWDIQYMHAQRRHGWPLVNGFSGFFPQTWFRNAVVKDVFESPSRAWWAVERSGASHVIVHEWAFRSLERGKRVSQWLRESGAVEVASTGNDTLFRLPGGLRHR